MNIQRIADWIIILAGVVVLLSALVLCGCATGNFNKCPVDPVKARQVYLEKRVWSGPCYPARVKRAKEILMYGEGRPWVAIYYMRCVPKDDWVGRIVGRRSKP